MVEVVVDLLDRLGGDGRQAGVRGAPGRRGVLRARQALVEGQLVGGEEELADDGGGEVAVRLLDQLAVEELPLAAEIGELVFVADDDRPANPSCYASHDQQILQRIRQREDLNPARCVASATYLVERRERVTSMEPRE